MLPWTPSAILSTEMYGVGGWAKTKLMRCQLLILMDEGCCWPEGPLYTSPHQATSPHSRATCPHRPAAAVCLSPHAMADRAMRWRTVGEVMAGCDRGDHAAADRDCKGPCKGPWWRKCGFYPPANPCRTFSICDALLAFVLSFGFVLLLWLCFRLCCFSWSTAVFGPDLFFLDDHCILALFHPAFVFYWIR